MNSFYIVPADLLQGSPPRGAEWHATSIPADVTQMLLVVLWDSSSGNAEIDFEAQPGVLWLGHPWDALPDAAAPLLASLQREPVSSAAASVTPSLDTPAAPDTVSTALRKLAWPFARR